MLRGLGIRGSIAVLWGLGRDYRGSSVFGITSPTVILENEGGRF